MKLFVLKLIVQKIILSNSTKERILKRLQEVSVDHGPLNQLFRFGDLIGGGNGKRSFIHLMITPDLPSVLNNETEGEQPSQLTLAQQQWP